MLTPEQEQVAKFPFHGKDSTIVVQAYAGTGKTSTLMELADCHKKDKILYLAYNKSMASEAKEKFCKYNNVVTSTIHSLAYKFIGYKYSSRLGNITPLSISSLARHFFGNVDKNTVSPFILGCFNGFLSSQYTDIKEYFISECIKKNFDFIKKNSLQPENIYMAIAEMWKATANDDSKICSLPVPHDVYLKKFQASKVQLPYSIILVDEAQDITDCMLEISHMQNSHKVFIGDTYQQIYSWNGAVDSLQKMQKQGATCLYLTKSFRCPGRVAAHANQYLRLMGASKQFVGNDGTISVKNQSSAYLARSNASIFLEAFKEVESGGHPYFLGGFAGYNFELLVDLAHAHSGKWAHIRNSSLKENFHNFQEIEQYAECDQMLQSRCNLVKKFGSSISAMYFKIKSNLTEEISDATRVFSTAHKAKGAEWRDVELAEDFLDMHDILNQLKQGDVVSVRKEELNLLYVAITRSMKNIVLPKQFELTDNHVEIFKHGIELKNMIWEI